MFDRVAELRRWEPGASVVWRSLPDGMVGTVFAAFVVEDCPDAVVLFQPAGAPRKRRTGRRGGPSGRNMLPNGWDGGYQESTFPGPSVVRLHPPGAPFSVIRSWSADEGGFQGWYINLEQPWERTPIGFDSRDDVLDIRADDDLGTWSWKDEDELEWSVEVGKISADQARKIRETGVHVASMLEARRWPFRDAAWSRYAPPPGRGLPSIPDGWATTDWKPLGQIPVRAVIFDLGGVLIDTGDPVKRRAWEATLGLEVGRLDELLAEAIGPGWEGGRSESDIWGWLQDRLGLPDREMARLRADLYAHEYLEPTLAEFTQTFQ